MSSLLENPEIRKHTKKIDRLVSKVENHGGTACYFVDKPSSETILDTLKGRYDCDKFKITHQIDDISYPFSYDKKEHYIVIEKRTYQLEIFNK